MSDLTGNTIISNIVNNGEENDLLVDSRFSLHFPNFKTFQEVIDFINEHKLGDICFNSYTLRKKVSDGRLFIRLQVESEHELARHLCSGVKLLFTSEDEFRTFYRNNPDKSSPFHTDFNFEVYFKYLLSKQFGVQDADVIVRKSEGRGYPTFRLIVHCNKTDDFDNKVLALKNIFSSGHNILEFSSRYELFKEGK